MEKILIKYYEIAITGTTGYIGSALFSFFSEVGFEVLQINRRSLDVKDSCTFDDFIQDDGLSCGVLIHCAGLVHSKSSVVHDFIDANVKLTSNLARSCVKKNVNKFIFVSTIGVLGNHLSCIGFNTKYSPYDSYTESKAKAELELQDILFSTNTSLVVVRLPLVIGKKAPGNVRNIELLLKFFPFTPFYSIENKKSILKVETLCDFLSRYKLLSEKLYMPTESKLYTTKEIFDLVARYNGCKFYHFPFPIKIFQFLFNMFGFKTLYRNLFADLIVKSD